MPSDRRLLRASPAVLVVWLAASGGAAQQASPYGFGYPATDAEIALLDIDVRPDGRGLPAGSGTVGQGAAVFANACAGCHGDRGQGTEVAPRLVGGRGSLATAAPVKTVGSYWPYATTLFDYVRRAMPYNAPQSLSADQVYAVSAHLLALNGVVAEDAVMDARTLPAVRMPNREGFTSPDPRPDVP